MLCRPGSILIIHLKNNEPVCVIQAGSFLLCHTSIIAGAVQDMEQAA